MNVALIATILIAIATLLGAWRTLRGARPYRALRVALQLAAGLLIWFSLFPPRVDERFAAGTLVVLHGLLPHRSAENRSDRSRHAYAVHVVEADAYYPEDNWLLRPDLPLRGFS